MPSLRWVTLIRAISKKSSSMTKCIYPIIQLAALEMLSVEDGFRESVTLIEHLIVPTRCGLRLYFVGVYVGFDQRKIWAIIEKKINSWVKNAPNRFLEAWSDQDTFTFTNLNRGNGNELRWGTEAEVVHRGHLIHLLDPVIAITLRLSNLQDTYPLFMSLFALFERTFYDTTHLNLRIDYGPHSGSENFLPFVDMFRDFVNLKELYLEFDSLLLFFLPLLQLSSPNSVLLPALQSLRLCNVNFGHTSTSLPRVVDFLRWRGEQGFPIQKVHIADSWVNPEFIQNLIQIHDHDIILEIDDSNYLDLAGVDD